MIRRPVCLILLVGLSGAGCASSESSVANVHTVVPGALVRGAQPDAAGFAVLQKSYGIRTVVNLNDATADSERLIVARLGMNYVAVPCDASNPDPMKFKTFLKVIEQERGVGPIYVHCYAGMDRTGMAVAAYRIVEQGWTGDRALGDLRSHQEFLHVLLFPGIPSFVKQVERDRRKWVAELHGAEAR